MLHRGFFIRPAEGLWKEKKRHKNTGSVLTERELSAAFTLKAAVTHVVCETESVLTLRVSIKNSSHR